MPHTGEKCQTSGIYDGVCKKNGTHRVKQLAVSVGNTFPPCNTATCSGAVSYTLVQATR